MASLINDKDTAKQFVRINFINDVSSLPDFQLAADRFLIPIIGQVLYDELLDEVLGHDFPSEGDDPADIEHIDLVNKCRAVIAPLGYLVELATIQTQITDAGLRSISTENMQAAHRWEFNEVRDHLEDKGSYAIEALLEFLFANIDDYEAWEDSDEYQELSQLIFDTGKDFNRYFRVHQPYRTWWELRPLISEVEDFYINSAIGKDFFKTLKENEADAGAEEEEAILLIKKAVAHYTVVRAIEKLSVRITPKGFTVLMSAGSSDAVNSGDAPARDEDLDRLYKSCERTGDSYLLQLVEHLNSKASDTVFHDFFVSNLYVAPSTTPAVSKNANRKLFGL